MVLEKKNWLRVYRNSRQVAMVLEKKIWLRVYRNSRQVAMVLEKKIGNRKELLLKRAAVLRKICLHWEAMVVKRD